MECGEASKKTELETDLEGYLGILSGKNVKKMNILCSYLDITLDFLKGEQVWLVQWSSRTYQLES